MHVFERKWFIREMTMKNNTIRQSKLKTANFNYASRAHIFNLIRKSFTIRLEHFVYRECLCVTESVIICSVWSTIYICTIIVRLQWNIFVRLISAFYSLNESEREREIERETGRRERECFTYFIFFSQVFIGCIFYDSCLPDAAQLARIEFDSEKWKKHMYVRCVLH